MKNICLFSETKEKIPSFIQEEKKYTPKIIKNILHKISCLSTVEHAGIFKILSKNNIPYTHNNNGIFVNFSIIPENIIQNIDEYVDECYTNILNEQKENEQIINIKEEKKEDNEKINEKDNEKEEEKREEEEFFKKIDWTNIISANEKNKEIGNILHHFEENIDNVNKKRATMKFTNAKRKYARKTNQDKKGENEIYNFLRPEKFIL